MSERARQLLVYGIASAKAKDIEQAKMYLDWVLRTDSTHAQKVRAWEWLAEIAESPKEKRDYLEEIIMREPGNTVARRGLAVLNGDISADEIIDSTHRKANQSASADQPDMQEAMHGPGQPDTINVKSKRFVCRQCGGTMAFTPNERALSCGYCDREITLFQAIEEGAMVEEKDFAVALATAKGHTSPVKMQAFTCRGCGAPFVLGATVLSLTCPYCSSPHVIEDTEARELIPPEGVVPGLITEEAARQHFYRWLKKKKLFSKCQVAPLRGVYLPVWTFDIAGKVIATVRGYNQGRATGLKMASQTIERPIFYNDVPVAASRRLPAKLAQEIHNYQLDQVKPYDPRYLADWPADTYQLSASDASLVARKHAWDDVRTIEGERIRDQVAGPFGSSDVEMTLSSADMYVEAFKLILLPMWITDYRFQDAVYQAIINGQNGNVRAQTPAGGLKRWLSGLLD